MELVEDDVAAALGQVHAHDDDVLAVRCVLDERNLGRLGANKRREPLLQIGELRLAEIRASFAGPLRPERRVLVERFRAREAHRMDRRRVQVRLRRRDGKIGAHRRRKNRSARHIVGKADAGRGRNCGGAQKELSAVNGHLKPPVAKRVD